MPRQKSTTGTSRREFLGTTALATGAAAMGQGVLASPLHGFAHGGADETVKVGLVGCGGRGGGAAVQALRTQGPVKLVAMGDAFEDNLERKWNELVNGDVAERVEVPPERRFAGFDAYQKVIDSGVDLVILTTPPHFRPIHLEYAIQQGKHVFMEKPVAVDAPGVRRVVAAAQVAKQKGLRIGVGLQRHHSPQYRETVRRIQEGAIGRIVLLRSYWNSGGVWVRPRQPEQTEMEYQMRNWYYFNWLCGDHIVEQHIHNLDVANWVMQGYPVRAQGQGGRQVRTSQETGEIYDHHFVEFTYADGTKLLSQCRHIRNTWGQVNEYAHGSSGEADIGRGRIQSSGGWDWRYSGDGGDPYQIEHDVLFKAVREGHEHNEAEYGAYSTMTSIFGRMATYSGKQLDWEKALASDLSLAPAAYTWDADPPTLPDAEGRYTIPLPGTDNVRAL